MTCRLSQTCVIKSGFWLLLLWASSVGLSQASGLDPAGKERLIDRIGQRLERCAVAYATDFSEWPEHVATHRAAIEAAETDEELEFALGEALAEFDLSHLRLFSPQQAKFLRGGLRSGIGVSIRPLDDGLFVTYVIKGSPAWAVGIRKLDTLTGVDGEPLRDVSQLFGSVGDIRSIEWRRGGKTFDADIEYQPFPLADESSMKWLNDDVAVVKIQSFQFRFYKLCRINRFFREAKDAKAIVVDLRNNRGGLAFFSQHLASKFSPRREVFALKVNRRSFRRAQRETGGAMPSLAELVEHAKISRPLPFSREFKGEVIVLVDQLSASGADIFPAFFQEAGRGIVIGERTSGALQLARTFRLPYGYRLYAPIAEVLTPAGRRLEKNGLMPDIELDFRQTASDAFIFQTALDALD